MREGWSSTALKNVCTVDKAKHSGTTLPYVGLEHIEGGTGKFIGSLAPATVKSTTFSFTASHVLYGRLRPYLNKVLLPEFDGHCSSEIFPLRVESSLDRRFLYYWLTWEPVVKEIDSTSTGARMPRANINKLLEFELPLPSLPEQKRIVAILDEAFAGIATAVANTEKNLANARELFESYLDSVFSNLPSGKNRQSLSALCGQGGITYGVIKLGNEWPSGVPCLRTSNVRRLHIDTRGMKRIDPALSNQYSRTILEGGEVLANVRGTLGGVAVATSDMAGWNVSREVAVIPVDTNKVLPEFAAYGIATRPSQDWLFGVQKGVAYRGINLTDLRELKIPVPSIDVQTRYVTQLNEMASNCAAIELRCRHKLSSLDELKQSLLQKAFSGELTAGKEDSDVTRNKEKVA